MGDVNENLILKPYNFRKIQNLESKSRMLLNELKKLYRQKKEDLYEAKQKFELMGGVFLLFWNKLKFVKKISSNSDNSGLKILIKEQESLKNSLANSQEMITVGRNIMSSLRFQGDSLKVFLRRYLYIYLNNISECRKRSTQY